MVNLNKGDFRGDSHKELANAENEDDSSISESIVRLENLLKRFDRLVTGETASAKAHLKDSAVLLTRQHHISAPCEEKSSKRSHAGARTVENSEDAQAPITHPPPTSIFAHDFKEELRKEFIRRRLISIRKEGKDLEKTNGVNLPFDCSLPPCQEEDKRRRQKNGWKEPGHLDCNGHLEENVGNIARSHPEPNVKELKHESSSMRQSSDREKHGNQQKSKGKRIPFLFNDMDVISEEAEEEPTNLSPMFHVKENEPAFPCHPECKGNSDGQLDVFRRFYTKTGREVSILSENGTIRGFRNRVKAGVMFIEEDPIVKVFGEREAGKVVLYVTSLGIVRETFLNCQKVRNILKTLMIRFEERDIFQRRDLQLELMERCDRSRVDIPVVFADGRFLGNASNIESLNEKGQLRCILRPYKRWRSSGPCSHCGGLRFLLCQVCHGSKRSELNSPVPLRCRRCDAFGLRSCDACSDE